MFYFSASSFFMQFKKKPFAEFPVALKWHSYGPGPNYLYQLPASESLQDYNDLYSNFPEGIDESLLCHYPCTPRHSDYVLHHVTERLKAGARVPPLRVRDHPTFHDIPHPIAPAAIKPEYDEVSLSLSPFFFQIFIYYSVISSNNLSHPFFSFHSLYSYIYSYYPYFPFSSSFVSLFCFFSLSYFFIPDLIALYIYTGNSSTPLRQHDVPGWLACILPRRQHRLILWELRQLILWRLIWRELRERGRRRLHSSTSRERYCEDHSRRGYTDAGRGPTRRQHLSRHADYSRCEGEHRRVEPRRRPPSYTPHASREQKAPSTLFAVLICNVCSIWGANDDKSKFHFFFSHSKACKFYFQVLYFSFIACIAWGILRNLWMTPYAYFVQWEILSLIEWVGWEILSLIISSEIEIIMVTLKYCQHNLRAWSDIWCEINKNEKVSSIHSKSSSHMNHFPNLSRKRWGSNPQDIATTFFRINRYHTPSFKHTISLFRLITQSSSIYMHDWTLQHVYTCWPSGDYLPTLDGRYQE